MPNLTAADTIRMLVATDNHVGYNERDAIRGDDSWRSFHEIMCLAKERDVDMVLLAGDLFHENKPSRKSMYQVMRSLRMNCYGEKPCELEMLSDASETFAGAFNHVNYEDPDINVAIPVFSIHGNHDDPSGEGHLAALDILQMSGLINYYGRTPESDNIQIKPVLLQKGNTKLALYGMSNVRDERLFRTFRDGNVKFFQPNMQKGNWFNILSVHQNHHAYTETGYLPEHFLPDFMDLVVWGHEHECKIQPSLSAEAGFRVMQPGSSVATSLVAGEAVAKEVAILSIHGKTFDFEPIRLKSVRPFKQKEIVLNDFKEMREIALDQENQSKIHRFLTEIVDEMIEEAREEWLELQRESSEEPDEEIVPPLPLIRLRVEITAPEGGKYNIENPQRFSNRFVDRVANTTDVVQTHRKRVAAKRATKAKADMPQASVVDNFSLENMKVDKLVEEFLTAQSLQILPQNQFSESVGQFVNKDDKNAMFDFIEQSLGDQLKQLLADGDDDVDEEATAELMEKVKRAQEEAYEKGELKQKRRKGSRKPKPDGWDTDMDGDWENNPASIIRSDDEGEDEDMQESRESSVRPATSGRGRGRGGRGGAATTRKPAATTKKAPAKKPAAKSRKKQVSEDEDEDDDEDVVMIDDDDDDDDDEGETLFVQQKKKPVASKAAAARSQKAPAKSTRGGKTAASSGSGRQTQIAFGSQANGTAPRSNGSRAAAPKKMQEPSDDEISDDEAFEPPPATARGSRTARR
ncbi:meiotic recombination [Saxophila tyrrhenica]|uniref:Double-strand break repair protein n=1 Tax=Saxophila tyrrhenica TaxID=1690608 RepID=A0AAV9P1F8_9PEZI|nr:meiotic recombination [Saxophila tyrrhenica]